MDNKAETLTFTAGYARLTEKYKDILRLNDNQVVAKTWIGNMPEEFTRQEREKLWRLDERRIKVLQKLLPFESSEIAKMPLLKLLSLYVANEMITTDVASGVFDLGFLISEIERIKTIDVREQTDESGPSYTTIVTFKSGSKILGKILSQSPL